jgi:putative redox protein
MAVEINVSYEGQLRCEASHGPSGASLTTDAPTDNGGRGAAFSPTDLVATALGTCVLTILGLAADRHGVDLTGTTVHVTKEMISDPLRRIRSLRTVVTVPQDRLQDPALRSEFEKAARHCPVHESLRQDIEMPIEFIYES